MLDRMRAIGLDVDDVLRAAGVDPHSFDDPDAFIEIAVSDAVMHEAQRRVGDDFGLKLGSQQAKEKQSITSAGNALYKSERTNTQNGSLIRLPEV